MTRGRTPSRLTRAGLVLFAALLTACVDVRMAGPGAMRAGALEMATPLPWNRMDPIPPISPFLQIWTANGMPLDHLLIVTGMPEGSWSLMPGLPGSRPMPNFRTGMSNEEVVAVLFRQMERSPAFVMFPLGLAYGLLEGPRSFDLTRIAPASLGAHPGFRFWFRVTGPRIPEREGTALVTIVDRRLYMILFEGTRLQHFPAGLPAVEEMMRTARIIAAD